ncbi:MAG TPA: hypothetical protein VG734_22905 [Lacunisphaera sp.]|nr:hypothetical protein [Lacunisphaera sp.]
MQTTLPPVQIFRQQCRHDDGWSDHYGALHAAAAYAGMTMPEHYQVRGIWQHGVCGPWLATAPGPLMFNSPQAGRFPVFVAREDEADYLRAEGYPRARAIGLPILYTAPSNLPRQAGSLLVMPTHTLVGATFADRRPFEEYAEQIKSIAPKFAHVTVCVHPNCQRNGLWVREFSERGLTVIFGAQTNDRNALARMRALFEQHESVTSNGWGSHIAYALAFGARASIWGSEIAITEANSLLDLSWSTDRRTLTAALQQDVQQARREFTRRAYRSPDDGLLDPEWGGWFIGRDHRISPAEMKAVLSEMVPVLPEFELVVQARRQRQAVRQEAARLAAARRNPEAVKLLLNLVQEAAKSKQVVLILETLREISADLLPLEPERSALLQEQARLLVARVEQARRNAA